MTLVTTEFTGEQARTLAEKTGLREETIRQALGLPTTLSPEDQGFLDACQTITEALKLYSSTPGNNGDLRRQAWSKGLDMVTTFAEALMVYSEAPCDNELHRRAMVRVEILGQTTLAQVTTFAGAQQMFNSVPSGSELRRQLIRKMVQLM